MSKCLITGSGGFIGSHLARYLLQKGLTVYGMVHRNSTRLEGLSGDFHISMCDILDKSGLVSILEDVKPDYVFHLAGQTFIPFSWQAPEQTFQVNVLGTLNLLEAIRNTNISPIIEVTGSSAEYGYTAANAAPLKETSELRPSSPYGVSKMAEDQLAYLYAQNYGLRLVRIRPFYVLGPGKTSYAPYDFARGIAESESGRRDSIRAGNLEAVRDPVDVQDAVRAIWLLAEKGRAGDVYNICSGRGTSIKEILDKLIALSRAPVKVETDPKLLRSTDESVLVGDCTKLSELGWKPRIMLDKTLEDILEYTRLSIK